ncbi:acyl-CoA dehydrogenase family protein [Corynebacterium glyciniphilum]|uniref:acyl-CoA dehydrogenase family protein n=1 Tax=Corynebacterium glyciniphilum TaxID=1404244 RepID=UPI0026548C9F|nr:acyl-CoA dehydrogenase family protein [Corynebacterium glyciniphilum]MDN5684176.1 acyl-CoA dehydrogenase family protein [Corynebacterium glyciniphilum]MDN6705540.1 acyl-CoA dehydrogenase family protein [Corynebacterium glyciniphilum]
MTTHTTRSLADDGLTPELAELRRTVEEFANEVVDPKAAENYRNHTFDYDVVAGMGELGLFGLPFSEEYGGMGGDYLALGVALEELARVDQSVAITLEGGCSLGAMPIYRFGSEEQKQRWLPDLLAGRTIAGFGLTEPEAGSDAGGTKTTATLDDGTWVINGSKQFITNSGTDITSVVTTTAVTGTRQDGRKEISAIVVPTDTPGFTAEPAYDKVGWNSSDTHPLSYDDVRVPEENLLGTRGRGFAQFLSILAEGRVALAALSTGVAQGCVDEAVTYARQRTSFGSPIAAYQGVSFKIARMEARAWSARQAWRAAAAKMLSGADFSREASIAKMVASEAAMDNARDATQVFGGAGFMNETRVARHYRDSKILEIGEGTTEVQLMLIARSLGLEDR